MTKKHDIMWLKSVDSTNEEARRHISDIDNLSVLSAYEQTDGRGQRGNSWHSAPGENLLFSIVLKFRDEDSGSNLSQIKAYDQFVLSEIAALSVTDLLSGYGIKACIKWPNDIYADEGKICGILVENSVRGSWLSHSIIGIGLNINQRNFDVNLPNPTSMSLITGEKYDIRTCLDEFMEIFESYIRRYLNITGGYLKLRRMYLSQLWRMGTVARYIDFTSLPSGHLDAPMRVYMPESDGSMTGNDASAGREFTGIIRGISDTGGLLVEDITDSTIREFGFKEIGYIL